MKDQQEISGWKNACALCTSQIMVIKMPQMALAAFRG